MGHTFTLVLNRTITDEESESLQKAGCAGAEFTTAAHPTNADTLVTRLDIATQAPSFAEAIQSALDAVKTIPDLKAASLIVPPQKKDDPVREETEPVAPAESKE